MSSGKLRTFSDERFISIDLKYFAKYTARQIFLFITRISGDEVKNSVRCSTSQYDDVIMGAIASQITSLKIVYSTVYSGADQSKHQSSASLAFVWGIHRGPVNSPHKWPVTRKMFAFDDVIMPTDHAHILCVAVSGCGLVFVSLPISSGVTSLALGNHTIVPVPVNQP